MKNNFSLPITNAEVLALAKTNPTFLSNTAGASLTAFNTAGFKELASGSIEQTVGVFNLLARVYLAKVKRPTLKNVSPFSAIVERMSNPFGALQQRIRTHIMKPTNPKYKGLVNGSGPDPFVQRFPTVEESFWKQNFDYSNNMSIQDTELRKSFLDQSGISELVGSIMYGFDAGKQMQEDTLIDEVFSRIVVDSGSELKATQKVEVPFIDTSDDDVDNKTQSAFINVFQNFASMLKNTRISSDFNAKGWAHATDPSDYVLFVRSDVYNYIKTHLMANTYHTENLGLPFKVVEVSNFGGITYTKTISGTATEMKPCYSTNDYNAGEVLGFNATGDPTATMYQLDEIDAVDPLATVDAVLVENGAMFLSDQHAYEIETIRNPRAKVTNYFASLQDRMIGYDSSYNVVKFYHSTSSANKDNKKNDSKKDKE